MLIYLLIYANILSVKEGSLGKIQYRTFRSGIHMDKQSTEGT